MSGTLITNGVTANDPTTTSTAGKVYYPMMRVLYTTDGGYLNPTAAAIDPIEPWPISINVQKSLWHHADRFQCEFPLFADEAFSYSFWGQVPRMIVSVEVSFDEATPQGRVPFIPWTSLIRGMVDVVSADVTKGVVSIRGRSVDSVFGDTRYNDSMLNETVADTVRRLVVDNHGFDLDIDDNGEIHGRIWGDDKDHSTLGIMSREINERDMLSRLANQFGYAFWLDADATVHFKKKPLDGEVWFINCPTPDFLGSVDRHKPSNFDTIKFEHNLIWSDLDAKVTASGVDVLTKEGRISVYPDTDTDEKKRLFQHLADQIDQDDLDAAAKNSFETIIGREWVLDATLADPTWVFFDMADNVNVQGTNSTFDGPYLMDVITYRLDARHGWSTNLKCKVGKPSGDLTAENIGGG